MPKSIMRCRLHYLYDMWQSLDNNVLVLYLFSQTCPSHNHKWLFFLTNGTKHKHVQNVWNRITSHMRRWTRSMFGIFFLDKWLKDSLIIKNIVNYFSSYQLITSELSICVCLCLNGLEDTSKRGKRQKNPGDDISDIEHLLDDQPISEFSLTLHVVFV